MSIKKILSFSLIIIIFAGIGAGGYYFINQQTQKRLAELEKESRTEVKKEAVFSPSPREIIPPGHSKAEKNSSFYLETDKEKYNVGDSFNLMVMVDAQGAVVDGAEFVLNYDPGLVEFGEPALGLFFSLYPQKTVDLEEGKVRVIALQGLDENKSLNQAIVVSYPVTARQKGKVNFEFDKEKTHIAGYGGQELLQKTTSLTIIIE